MQCQSCGDDQETFKGSKGETIQNLKIDLIYLLDGGSGQEVNCLDCWTMLSNARFDYRERDRENLDLERTSLEELV